MAYQEGPRRERAREILNELIAVTPFRDLFYGTELRGRSVKLEPEYRAAVDDLLWATDPKRRLPDGREPSCIDTEHFFPVSRSEASNGMRTDRFCYATGRDLDNKKHGRGGYTRDESGTIWTPF